jgi:hypothetical protein
MKCVVDGCDNEANTFLDYQGGPMVVCSECDTVVGFSREEDVKILSKKEFDLWKIMDS